jgi:hypothetical protein
MTKELRRREKADRHKAEAQEILDDAFNQQAERALTRAKNILQQRDWRATIKQNTIFSAFEVGKLAQIHIDWISHETTLRLVDSLIHDFQTEFFPVKRHGAFVGYVKGEKFRALFGPEPV